MDERLRLWPPLLEGEKMARCAPRRHFAEDRVQDLRAVQRLRGRSVHRSQSAAYRQANRLPAPIEATIAVEPRVPGWGAPKIREKLRQQVPGVQLRRQYGHAVLDRHGLVKRRRRRRPAAAGTALSRPTEPNALWCAELQRRVPARQSAILLSAHHHDFASRYLLTCEALSTTQEHFAFTVFERTFQDFGLPGAIRTTTGCPLRRGMRSSG